MRLDTFVSVFCGVTGGVCSGVPPENNLGGMGAGNRNTRFARCVNGMLKMSGTVDLLARFAEISEKTRPGGGPDR